MIRKNSFGVAAAVAAVATAFVAPVVHADSLKKIGKAIQYPVRKSTENLSVDVHRAEGRKSVVSMRPQRNKAVVTPGGHKVVYAHRFRGHHHYTHVRPHRVP